MLPGFYHGVIEKVFPPTDPENLSKYQFEYRVVITADLFAQIPTRCIKNDTSFGNFNGYEDLTLEVGYRVFVQFPSNSTALGVIMGGSRYHSFAEKDEGVHYRKRFNEIEEFIDHTGTWGIQVRPISKGQRGPNLYIGPAGVRIGDDFSLKDVEDSIVIDRQTRTITITCGTWNVKTKKGAHIDVTGNLSISCLNADISVKNSAKISALSLEANITANAKINVSGKADIKGQIITLNGSDGMILTTATQPACYITGIPFIGDPTVLAGVGGG